MSFFASSSPPVTVASGGGNVIVPVPQVIDIAGNGYSGNAFSHYQIGTAGPPIAISPGIATITVAQTGTAQTVYFGRVGET